LPILKIKIRLAAVLSMLQKQSHVYAMKLKLLSFALATLSLLPIISYAQLNAKDGGGCLNYEEWYPVPDEDEAGHATYETYFLDGGAPCRVRWSVTNNRWEIIAALEADGEFNDLLYYNTTNTSPNPPALGVGTWTDSGFGCGPLQEFSGPYTSNAAGKEAPTVTTTAATAITTTSAI